MEETKPVQVVIVDEPNILEMTLKATTLSDDFVDQELEDAAKDHARYGGPFSTHRQNYEYIFIQGATWKAEQVANDAIEFAEWCSSTHYRYDPIYKTWRYDADSYTSKEFYELWQQSKKK